MCRGACLWDRVCRFLGKREMCVCVCVCVHMTWCVCRYIYVVLLYYCLFENM